MTEKAVNVQRKTLKTPPNTPGGVLLKNNYKKLQKSLFFASKG